MKNIACKLFVFSLVVSLSIFACGGGGEESPAVATSDDQAPEKTEQAAEMSPTELGQAIADLYEKTMREVTELLQDKPAVADVQSELEAMKEECIQKMVALGKLREALDESARSTVDLQLRMKARSINKEPFYSTYNDIQMHYFQEKDFHKTVLSFNIITQYATFELLKKQEPEEAQRLGIQ